MQPFPVYVIHARKLETRRTTLERTLEQIDWRATWIKDADPEDLGFRHWLRRVRNPRLTRGEVSVYEKQILAWRAIAAAGEAALVLEDDPVFPVDFESRFEIYVNDLPKAWDLVFFGASCGMEASSTGSYAEAWSTRSLSGYLIGSATALRLANVLSSAPIRQPIDHAVNRQIETLSLQCFWSVPSLIANGSELGLVQRSIDGGRTRRALRTLRRMTR